MSKVILDLCGGTGAWSRPYQQAGYDVKLITLPEYDVTDTLLHDDLLKFYGVEKPSITIPWGDIYGILAAPPCTEFSLAKNGSPAPRDLRAGMQVVEACLRIVWECQLHGSLKFWALENPLGLLRRFLGRPKYTFRQWEFGDLGIKPTDIWGFFNDPKKTVNEMPEGITKRYKSGKVNSFAWSAPKAPDWIDIANLTRADIRAITPAGFAEAFYKANK